MNKIGIVIQREYLTRVKRKAFLVFTIVMPLVFLGVIIMPIFLALNEDTNKKEKKEVLVIDQTGKYLDLFVDQAGYKFVRGTKALQAYRSQALEADAYAYVYISEDLLKNPKAITIYATKQVTPELFEVLKKLLLPSLNQEKIDSYGIPELAEIIDNYKASLDISIVKWSRDSNTGEISEDQSSSVALLTTIGVIFNTLIYGFIITYCMMVMQSVREEKKNRIIEIIVSSIPSHTLLFGKIIAIGLVGITQMSLWLLLAAVGIGVVQFFFFGELSINPQTLYSALSDTSAMGGGLFGEISLLSSMDYLPILASFVFYFIMGYLVYASLFAALGAIVDSDEDTNQMMAPLMFILVFTFYSGVMSAKHPDSTLALWTSMVPFSSPMVMMARLPFDPPLWQILLSGSILILSSALLVWIAAKIFRVGILMYGKKPSVKELWKWLSYK